MKFNMQQQITIIAAWEITYDIDPKAVSRVKRDFNVLFQSSTLGKWRKRRPETGRIQKGKSPGRPRSSTDTAITFQSVANIILGYKW